MVLVLMWLVFVLVRISKYCYELEEIMRSIRIYLRSDAWLMVDLMLSRRAKILHTRKNLNARLKKVAVRALFQ